MGKVYMLRTCRPDMTAHGGFRWPESGPVECPDWDPSPRCGGGLHGLLHGEGDGDLLDSSTDARWLIVECDPADVVGLGGKVKVPRGVVVYCGDRDGATARMAELCPGRAISYGTATAGAYGTVCVRWYDGRRYRLAVGYVGEDGIEAGVAYRVRDGKLVRA